MTKEPETIINNGTPFKYVLPLNALQLYDGGHADFASFWNRFQMIETLITRISRRKISIRRQRGELPGVQAQARGQRAEFI
ncbi:hypothetical protein [Cohnella thailandensis]|uniref:Uncharacterized protein n=1 Tax=Cohnella thailandensis TaxID=557557 RepID=A0A841T358_9BACL|nr:hypothetical protein [Cohnella thailandensis]MBB6637296.1 hypothetical protein [Cohnella thailandensis]MBP1976624.1 hypothetical protein [Cohnella thailandensis]